MPPGGSYNPAITLESILLSIQLLLASPNPDDPLRNDVSDEFKYNRELFNERATKYSGTKVKAVEPMQTSKHDANDNKTKVEENAEAPTEGEPSGQSSAKVSRKRKHEET